MLTSHSYDPTPSSVESSSTPKEITINLDDSVSFSPETESETLFTNVSPSSTDEIQFLTPVLYFPDISDVSTVSEDATGSSLITTTIEAISRITGSSMSPFSTTETIQTVPTTVSDDCPEPNGIYPYPETVAACTFVFKELRRS
ncbi:hypothetical protein CEXT_729841 [Caerostris extrusa]|uniref:Uncharacterized protein n=1 Tax=Caerostris extrusa TaxID=172846 RepID=A0AAV4MJA0_CAEEX|nr:hypothetical protein CEXT_729841 [Caerostris extrusa]